MNPHGRAGRFSMAFAGHRASGAETPATTSSRLLTSMITSSI
jgi:hypothetical protein